MPRKLRVRTLDDKVTKMDKIDLAIIENLTEDARKSFRKIAKELDISPDTVINRYTALHRKGVIRGSTIVIDPTKIGYQALAIFVIEISHAHVVAGQTTPVDSSLVLKKIIQMPNIIVATKSIGDHDLLAIGVVKSFEHLIRVRNDIAKIHDIRDIQVSFWVERTELCPRYFIV